MNSRSTASMPMSLSQVQYVDDSGVALNRVMVELGPSTFGGVDDALCVFNAVGVMDVIADANGWYGSSSAVAAGYQYPASMPTAQKRWVAS